MQCSVFHNRVVEITTESHSGLSILKDSVGRPKHLFMILVVNNDNRVSNNGVGRREVDCLAWDTDH
jgi:hypothetical protein